MNFLAVLLASQLVLAPASDTLFWKEFARNAQHAALSTTTAQPLNHIRWQIPVDLQPQYSGDELLIHYGSPLLTGANTIIIPVKTGVSDGFRVEAHSASDGFLLWSLNSDYTLPPHDWTPVFGPALTGQPRVYFPAAGGTVFFRDSPDSVTGGGGRFAFYGIANYRGNAAAYNSAVMINTPITSDQAGNIYFGFSVTGSTSLNLQSGIARITPGGTGTWISAPAAAGGDSSITGVLMNCAPAVTANGSALYVAVADDARSGYLVKLDSTTLSPVSRVRLIDPLLGSDAQLNDDGTASPGIGPDGDVYFGVLETDIGSNHGRGWMLHFDASLAHQKTPGAFGWDDTASLLPVSMVPSYTGSSTYLIMTKYNNYAELGGDGVNKIAVLDPGATMIDPVTGVTVMNEVLTIAGPTPDPEFTATNPNAVKEWCINSAVTDPKTKSVFANNEDGKLYRWDLTTNTLSESIVLTRGLGEAYTSTLMGPDGTVYATNNATLFAIGQ